jgi:hypothetical protein
MRGLFVLDLGGHPQRPVEGLRGLGLVHRDPAEKAVGLDGGALSHGDPGYSSHRGEDRTLPADDIVGVDRAAQDVEGEEVVAGVDHEDLVRVERQALSHSCGYLGQVGPAQLHTRDAELGLL